MSNGAILRFLVAFFLHIWSFMLLFGTIWVFWAFYAVLLQTRFGVIYALFWGKIFCGSNHFFEKKLSFCMLDARICFLTSGGFLESKIFTISTGGSPVGSFEI